MPSKGAMVALAVVGCCILSMCVCVIVYFTKAACGFGKWAGYKCPAPAKSPGPGPGPGQRSGSAPAPQGQLASLSTGRTAIQVAPLTVTTADVPFPVSPPGYTAGSVPSYTISFEIVISGPSTQFLGIFTSKKDSTTPVGPMKTPFFCITPSNHERGEVNKILLYSGSGTSIRPIVSTEPIVMDGTTKTRVTMTVSGNNLFLFINGILVGSSSECAATIPATFVPSWVFMGNPGTNYTISNFYYWNRVLTYEELCSLNTLSASPRKDVIKAIGQAIQTSDLVLGDAVIPFTNKPQNGVENANWVNYPPSYTFSFDITMASVPTDWISVFMRGDETAVPHVNGPRMPAVFVAPTGALQGAGKLEFYSGGWPSLLTTNPLVPGSKTSIAITVSGATTTMYRNGTLDNTITTGAATYPGSDPATWNFNSNNPTSRDTTKNIVTIGNMYYWPVALTAADIALLKTTSTSSISEYEPEPFSLKELTAL